MATVSSTNRLAKEKLHPLLPEGTVIWADQQTDGYGRRGHAWESLPNNLMFSLVLWPEKPLPQLSQLSFVASLVVGETITPLLRSGVVLSYKWPNDVLLDGQKVCGILLETETLSGQRYPAVVLGMGINVENAPRISDKPVTALAAYAKEPLVTEKLLTTLLDTFARFYERWKEEGFAWVQEAWLRQAYLFQQPLVFEEGTHRTEGQFVDIDHTGGIVLQTNNKYKKVFYTGQIII
jgi:BirA family biotin operon repressor/biotin-[acetyl-CoA-carboxylase] ligase